MTDGGSGRLGDIFWCLAGNPPGRLWERSGTVETQRTVSSAKAAEPVWRFRQGAPHPLSFPAQSKLICELVSLHGVQARPSVVPAHRGISRAYGQIKGKTGPALKNVHSSSVQFWKHLLGLLCARSCAGCVVGRGVSRSRGGIKYDESPLPAAQRR